MTPTRPANREPDPDEGVLTPEELVLEDDRVDELDENRYVIRTDRDPVSEPSPTLTRVSGSTSDALSSRSTDASAPATGGLATPAPVLEAAPEPHGIDVTLKTDGELAHLHATSHDVREVFREFLRWYASQLDEDLTPAQALSVLLRTTDLEA